MTDNQDLDLLHAAEAYRRLIDTQQTLLRTLPDFHLIELIPETGHYVAGFSKAYAIDLQRNTLRHLRG
jgi:putative heme iron utilization protein